MSVMPPPRVRRSPRRIAMAIWRRIALRLQHSAAGPASRNGFLASLYFTFFSTQFYREHRAVLMGQREYLRGQVGIKSSFGGFRRNVHRLEKALVMLPRRKIFAEKYIGATVDQFTQASCAESRIDANERKWAGDILTEYFSVVEDTAVIARARRKFVLTGHADSTDNLRYVPYAKQDIEPSGVSFEQLRKVFIERRSVRWFKPDCVPIALIEQAVEAASWAPTACNRLPYLFHVFTDARTVVEIAALAGGTAGFVDNIPCLIVVVGDLSNYIEERDRHLIYIDGALASMQLMLALQALGLSSVPINWPDVEEREIRMAEALGLAPYERPIMLIGIGYGRPEGLIPYSQKKPASLLMRHENRESR